MGFLIRPAAEADVDLILAFICELAVYEELQDNVIVTPALLHDQLFVKKRSACVLAFEDEVPVGFALYFFNFSTFLGRNGLYLEDLFVRPDYRGKGYGKQLLTRLTELAREEGCGRMEWTVLDWNQPAIDFYEKLGARAMKEWQLFRLDLL